MRPGLRAAFLVLVLALVGSGSPVAAAEAPLWQSVVGASDTDDRPTSAVVHGNRIAIADEQGCCMARSVVLDLRRSDGSVVWEFACECDDPFIVAAPNTSRIYYAGTRDQSEVVVGAVDPEDGHELWQRRISSQSDPEEERMSLSPPMMTKDGACLLVPFTDYPHSHLACFTPTGDRSWTYQTPRKGSAIAVAYASSGIALFLEHPGRAEGRNHVRAFDLGGHPLWSEPVCGDSMAVTGGVVVTASGLCTDAHRAGDGGTLWRTRWEGHPFWLIRATIAAVRGGVAVLRTGRNHVFLRIYGSDGRIRWTTELPATPRYTGMDADASGLYVVGSLRGDILALALDLKRGHIRWRSDIDGPLGLEDRGAFPLAMGGGLNVFGTFDANRYYDYNQEWWDYYTDIAVLTFELPSLGNA